MIAYVVWYVIKTLVIVAIIGSCISLCCCCCKKRKTKKYQMTVYHVPQPAFSPECQPYYPGYQPVPFKPGHSMSAPPPPPSYQEATLSQMNPLVDNNHSFELKLVREDLQV